MVLFAWSTTVDLDALPISHPAEEQALADLLTRLELETDVPGVTQEEVDAAPGGRRPRPGPVTRVSARPFRFGSRPGGR